MVKRDRWAEATEAHLEELRQRRRGVVDAANAFKAEAERRLQAYKDELDAVKAEISAVENALEAHRIRVEAAALVEPPQLRALPSPDRPTPAAGTVAKHAGRRNVGVAADTPRALIFEWARQHGGLVVRSEWTAHYVDSGRFTKEQAHAAFGNALNTIRTGFVRESPGVYRFHSIDGQALRPLEEAELAAPA